MAKNAKLFEIYQFKPHCQISYVTNFFLLDYSVLERIIFFLYRHRRRKVYLWKKSENVSCNYSMRVTTFFRQNFCPYLYKKPLKIIKAVLNLLRAKGVICVRETSKISFSHQFYSKSLVSVK